MADIVVAGIARTSDPAQLEKLLAGCTSLARERFVVITKAGHTQAYDDSPLRFVHSSTSSVSSGTGGTGVPGIGRKPTLSSLVGRGYVPHYLQNTSIPRDVAENYNIAIDEGRSVVTYQAPSEDTAAIEQTFRSCGLLNVRTFKPVPST
ncbi:MAG: hypothetical protein ACXWNJ_08705 [Vulcanimicrobiaceae bacterium]